MAYTHRSKDNLLEEGVERERVYVIGNPIFEVLTAYEGRIDRSDVLQRFKLKTREYFAVTLHRTENVDVVPRLQGILDSLQAVHEKYRQPVIVSLHPRTADRMQAFGLKKQSYDLVFTHPLGLFDWVQLEKNARCVITDSGTLQDECSIFHVPIVTLRDVTERAETQEAGSNILAGANRETMLRAVDVVLSMPTEWTTPPEYLEKQVSVTVAKILLGPLPFTRTRLQACPASCRVAGKCWSKPSLILSHSLTSRLCHGRSDFRSGLWLLAVPEQCRDHDRGKSAHRWRNRTPWNSALLPIRITRIRGGLHLPSVAASRRQLGPRRDLLRCHGSWQPPANRSAAAFMDIPHSQSEERRYCETHPQEAYDTNVT